MIFDMDVKDYGVIPKYDKDPKPLQEAMVAYCRPEDNGGPGLDEIRRKDYISFINMEDKQLKDFLSDKMLEIASNYNENKILYKDYIFLRHYFKEFVIREKVRDENGNANGQTRYYHYKISGDRNKTSDFRVLNINVYTSFRDRNVLELSAKVFAAHTTFLFLNVISSKPLSDDNFNSSDIFCGDSIYMYLTLPNGGKAYVPNYGIQMSAKEEKFVYNFKDNDTQILNNYLSQAIGRYVVVNYYMLNKVESNESVSIDDKEYDSIVEYVKSKAKLDKKVRINLDKDYNIKLVTDPKRRNIYSHDNYQLRKLCDYKFQVKAHYQRYHYKDGSIKWLWKESFFKNKDKEFNIIKERYMEGGV